MVLLVVMVVVIMAIVIHKNFVVVLAVLVVIVAMVVYCSGNRDDSGLIDNGDGAVAAFGALVAVAPVVAVDSGDVVEVGGCCRCCCYWCRHCCGGCGGFLDEMCAFIMVRPTNNQEGITAVVCDCYSCWLFIISLLIVCSTIDWLAGPCLSQISAKKEVAVAVLSRTNRC